MAKFKIGEKVRIRADIEDGIAYGGWYLTPDVKILRGKTGTVTYSHSSIYKIDSAKNVIIPGCFLEAAPDVSDNNVGTYRDNIIALLDRQHDKGLKKYGETLEDNTTLSTRQRIEHLQEELIDGLQYCEHIKVVNDHLTANDYQRMALRTASTGEDKDAELRNAILGLCGESGECADIVKKADYQGHDLDKNHLAEEVGDVAWYVALAADALGMTLEEVLQRNVDKLKARYPDGFDKARSINRKE